MKVSDVLEGLGSLTFKGNAQSIIDKVVPIDSSQGMVNYLTWSNLKNIEKLKSLNNGTVIAPLEALNEVFSDTLNIIATENPRQLFQTILAKNFTPRIEKFISSSASISPDAKIAADVYIGHNVVVSSGCIIGQGSIIQHNTVILEDTIIGKNVKIGCNCTIGGVGFGYEKNISGEWEIITHLGNVKIEDNVEIGNNTCIDRGVLGSTEVKSNVKIDNLVHVAHGVKIGENSLVIANSMIAGSVEIGANTWIAPSSSIKNGLKIGDNAFIGMSAVVIKDVEVNTVVIGNPAKQLVKR
jgi:UDP-3-O-[3-hydroxymyristoyl] glucosamine N-acyltransferase